MAAGDFNGDGIVDLAVLDYINGTGTTLGFLKGMGMARSRHFQGHQSRWRMAPILLSWVISMGTALDLAVASYNSNKRKCLAGEWRWHVHASYRVSNQRGE
jgi:hypothetical protein